MNGLKDVRRVWGEILRCVQVAKVRQTQVCTILIESLIEPDCKDDQVEDISPRKKSD